MLSCPSLLTHADQFAVFRLFKYLTFRSGGAVITALFFSFIVNGALIRWLKVKQGHGQPIRIDGPQRHIVEKQGTPTMGGLLILLLAVHPPPSTPLGPVRRLWPPGMLLLELV